MQPDSSKKAKKKGQLYCIASSVKTTSNSDQKIYGKVCKSDDEDSLPGVKTDLHIMYKWALKN